MKKHKNNVNKNIKDKTKDQEGNEKKNYILNENNLTPKPNIYPNDNTNSQFENFNNVSNNENNIIANILETNKIENDIYKVEEYPNKNLKNNKKKSAKNMLIYNEYMQAGDFGFINISETVIPFLYQQKQSKEYSNYALNNFQFLDVNNTYKMIINIIIDEDSLNSSKNLSKIFEILILSLKSLSEIKINNKDFLVCIFFQHFKYEENFQELFPGLNFKSCNNWDLKSNNFYISYGNVLSVNDTPINTLIFYKESSTFVQIYKFFYCYMLQDLMTLINADSKEKSKTFLVINWPNGKIYKKTINKYHQSRIISEIFRICNNRNMVLIPDINYYPNSNIDTFGYLNKYNFDNDKVNTNLYWGMICGYPIDHRFFFINMNYQLYLLLRDYYHNNMIDIYANPYYHDYNLSIYLRKNMKNLTIQKIQQVEIQYNDIPLTLVDFYYDYILRKGSHFANFFDLFSYFFTWKNMSCFKFIQKIVIFFKLFSFIFQFFWLGLSFLIFYAVFNDAFGSDDNKMDYFGSLGYVILVIILLFISLLYVNNKPRIKKNKINRNYRRNEDSYVILLVLYFIHYLYFCFFFICTIIALVHIKQGKYHDITDSDYYIFKKNFFIIILIVNILVYILPSFLRPTNLISKGFLLYLLVQLPNVICFFHLPYLFTCVRNISSKREKTESLYITLYILLNGLLTIVCLIFDTKRKRRMDFLYIITIIFTILNVAKTIILVFGFCIQNNFNHNISTGDIPQYNISNDEYNYMNNNNIYNNDNNIKNMNNNIKNLKYDKNSSSKKNNSLKDKKIIKNNDIENIFEKKHSSQIDLNDINEERKCYLSNRINTLKNDKLQSEFDNNQINKDKIKNNLSKSLNLEKSNSSNKKLENEEIINNNQENNINNRNYPMDSEENNFQENKNENYNTDNNLSYSNRKSNNYPVDNIEPFSLKDKNSNDINNTNVNNISSSDIDS